MATLTLRGNTWTLGWTDPSSGERIRRAIGDRRVVSESDARAALATLRYELATGNPILGLGRRSNTVTWAELAQRYLEWHATQYPSSHWRVRLIVEKHLNPWFQNKALALITREHAEHYVVRRTEHVAPSTVLKELRTLKAMFNKGVEWQLVDRNSAHAVRPPRDLRSSPVAFYAQTELTKLYQSSSPRNAAIWKLLANTGMRRAEALNLRWSDVSDNAITIVSRQGARTKSGKWRHVPISPGAAEALETLRGMAKTERVLPSLAGHSLTRQFDRDLRKAGLGGNLHRLRHTFAAHLVMGGIPLYAVKTLLGHASVTTTEIYAHLAPEHLQATVKGMNL